ncbi:MAG: Yip1 domain protein [Pelotomaculum sp. PtaU1.Bin035]|nr:MAG: Yip1 domain protein [Pelotomaculum sp. PtaU1.Bin035]
MNGDIGGRKNGQGPGAAGAGDSGENGRIPGGESFFEGGGPVINPEINPEINPSPGGADSGPDFLELVYGVLFDPVKTMESVARRPPAGFAFLIVTILGVLGVTTGLLTVSRVFAASLPGAGLGQFLPAVRALAPLGVIFGLLWGYVKWFAYSAVVHLAAELLGGRGSARGVFAAAGLSGLPSIFMVPVDLLAYWLGAGKLAVTILVGLAGLAALIWSATLLVIGLMQVHGLTAGRSVLAVLSPFLAAIALGVLIVAALAAVAASLPAGTHFPGYF